MGKVMIVTGASRGIGAATARLAAERGYDVAVNFHSRADAAEQVAADCRAKGARAIAVQGDMGREADIQALLERVDGELGPLAALVNNAGTTGPVSRLADLSHADLMRVLELNVAGYMMAAREAVRRMSTARGGAGGAIVNVSSRASELGGPNEWIHYGASKGATDTLTIGLAREVAREGIRVNAVNPGLIDTDIHASAGMPDRIERLKGTVPMGREGTADEVARAILWLLSEDASYVTGTLVHVSGGR
jgi:NAD(P)-dependent dehydrogenase (short-subunit alcohol dehydrogenase family)